AKPSAKASIRNESPTVPGTADFYAWGLQGNNAKAGQVGLRAVGVQSFADQDGAQVLFFAINTFKPWPNNSENEFDVLVDTNADGTLAPGQDASVPLTIDPAEWKLTPALGVMVVGLENFNGSQARLLGIGRAGDGQ